MNNNMPPDEVMESAMDICRKLAALRDGLDNSNSSAEEMAARLAHRAQVLVVRAEMLANFRAMIDFLYGSPEKFAKVQGASFSYVSAVLNGRRAMPERWAALVSYTNAPKRRIDMNPNAATAGAQP